MIQIRGLRPPVSPRAPAPLAPPRRDGRGANWTPAMEEALRTLWRSGAVTAAIADTLGNGLSRNAVIGKARRMELPMRKPPIAVDRR
jgi:hypothetical protein